jgi:hypothetical protein
MQPREIPSSCPSRKPLPEASTSSQVSELAQLIDAIPSEYREDLLLAALRLSKSGVLTESYLVGVCREQLFDCLMQRTATMYDFAGLRQLDRNTIERQLHPFAVASDPAQVTIALCALLDFLIDVL